VGGVFAVITPTQVWLGVGLAQACASQITLINQSIPSSPAEFGIFITNQSSITNTGNSVSGSGCVMADCLGPLCPFKSMHNCCLGTTKSSGNYEAGLAKSWAFGTPTLKRSRCGRTKVLSECIQWMRLPHEIWWRLVARGNLQNVSFFLA
jgi:hypothetical protein